jgi:hypothetical protein
MITKACLMAACIMLLAPIVNAAPAQARQMTAREIKAWSLPPTHLDSFVYHALISGHAEHIYGDEGTFGPPPQQGFNIKHRINIGIVGERDEGLTTGHGSYLPDAWGSDEFLRSPGAWSQSGANYGDHKYNGVDGSDNSSANEGGGWADTAGGGGNGNGGGSQSSQPKIPYAIGPNWIAVQNTHDGNIMGYMAPGETLEDFFSGRSGHILPMYAEEGRYILENQLPMLQGKG